LAILWTLLAGVWRRAQAPLIVAVAFFAQWLPWAANPKGLEFYYYYYPSIVCLGPALALLAASMARPWRDAFVCCATLIAAAAFAFFLPILASGIGVGPSAFEARIWLPTWR
jgi:dolichyl-phosphate-mannose--protein O-mannosyl transferase